MKWNLVMPPSLPRLRRTLARNVYRWTALLASGGMCQFSWTRIGANRIPILRPPTSSTASRPTHHNYNALAAAQTQLRINNNNRILAAQLKGQREQQALNDLWPAPPLHGAGYQLTPGGTTFSFGPAVAGPAPGDTTTLPATPAGLSGVLIYDWEAPGGAQYLVFRGHGGKYASAQVKPYSVVHYAVKQPISLRDLRITGSGNTLFMTLAAGGTDSSSTSSADAPGTILRWNLLDSSLGGLNARVPSGSQARFSPDGKFAAVAAPLASGATPQDTFQSWRDGGNGWLEVSDSAQPYRDTSSADWSKYQTALDRYADYAPAEDHDSKLRGLPVWRVSNRAAVREVVWTARGHLLYTHEGAEAAVTGSSSPAYPDEFPSIWMANPDTHTAVKVVDRGYDPVPSPDGRWLAFYGWSSADHPAFGNPGSAPTLSFYDGESKTGFHVEGTAPAVLRWTPDSKTLILGTYGKDGNSVAISTLTVPSVIPTKATPMGREHKLVTIKVKDPMQLGAKRPGEAITLDGVSSNGQYLLVEISQFNGVPGTVGSEERTLEAVDVTTGARHIIARVIPPVGTKLNFAWTWFEIS